jgi:hypothetical protein
MTQQSYEHTCAFVYCAVEDGVFGREHPAIASARITTAILLGVIAPPVALVLRLPLGSS